jgi:site-specific recombinase XerD
MASGRPEERELVFPNHAGTFWTDAQFRNWRKRIFAPAAQAAGVEKPHPYALRHSFVSLLLAEGATVVEVAAQAGNSPAVVLSTYAHVIAELEGHKRKPAAKAIHEARSSVAARKVGTH